MYVTDRLINFLNTSKNLSNSTIVLTDTQKVIFVASDFKNTYLNKRISNDLIRIFKFI